MWVVIHMIKGEESAQRVCDRLKAEGILSRMRPVYKATPPQENYFEIQVLQSELHEAREILMELGL